MNYQLLYIIDNGLADADKDALIEKFNQEIVNLGGTVDSTEKWGTRKLAYIIDGKNEGYYILVKFTASASVPAEIDRQMRINDSIVRQMITRI